MASGEGRSSRAGSWAWRSNPAYRVLWIPFAIIKASSHYSDSFGSRVCSNKNLRNKNQKKLNQSVPLWGPADLFQQCHATCNAVWLKKKGSFKHIWPLGHVAKAATLIQTQLPYLRKKSIKRVPIHACLQNDLTGTNENSILCVSELPMVLGQITVQDSKRPKFD